MRFPNINIIVFLAVLGSVVRIIYGIIYTPWDFAPDQIAWELVLKKGTWSYDQLIHYPHEGGSILVSIVSRFIGWFTSFNSLTISAIGLDFISRFLQIYIVFKILPKKIACLFGGWTLFATPSILIWGTVNFGLHNLSSVFPFVLLYFMSQDTRSTKFQIGLGAFLGFSIWFSYINIVLLPIYLIHSIYFTKNNSNRIFGFITFTLICCLHLIVRIGFDSGFHLSHLDLTSIRGTVFHSIDISGLKHLFLSLARVLPNAAVGFPSTSFMLSAAKYIWIGITCMAFIGINARFKKRTFPAYVFISFLIIPIFLILYGISPFYYGNSEFGNFISYRHFTYIFPFLSLMIILGLSEFRYRNLLFTFFLGIHLFTSGFVFFQKHQSHTTSTKAAGWVLGYKFGHDPYKLQKIISDTPDHNQLIEGCGWGVCTSLFEKPSATPDIFTQRMNQLEKIISQFPPSDQVLFLKGVKYAFSSEVTPQLPQNTLNKILERTSSKPH